VVVFFLHASVCVFFGNNKTSECKITCIVKASSAYNVVQYF